ncbi:MAG: L,D-transpeptidase family protein [Proteobacteria bacterium]|nr:L,D-transpeptidase family protein [Pseudomonadota bacterium]
MNYLFVFLLSLTTLESSPTNPAVDSVLVVKSERKMYLLANGSTVNEYAVVFGRNPVGHKQQEGDGRTPEGRYTLDFKNADSAFYKSIKISYPDAEDTARAEKQGVSPGGLIMIHGQKNGSDWARNYDWTDGCIAVTNAEMDELWQLLEEGFPIEIRP